MIDRSADPKKLPSEKAEKFKGIGVWFSRYGDGSRKRAGRWCASEARMQRENREKEREIFILFCFCF